MTILAIKLDRNRDGCQPVSATCLVAEVGSALTWTDLLTGRCCRPGGADAASVQLAAFQTLWLRAGNG